ncbi:hypothetical protein BDY24DRAFT_325753, partial [Mrakia frigida]|uniref:mitochondrial 54S ribosomal protein uL30m MRPL33 n=1 Tax=Mrakia frigida TaxID=29902 RepID=UPI003FCC0FF5
HGPATHYRIQLKRSPIGLPEVYGKTLQRLGLLKKDRTVYAPFGATVAGQILRVKELVTVRNV